MGDSLVRVHRMVVMGLLVVHGRRGVRRAHRRSPRRLASTLFTRSRRTTTRRATAAARPSMLGSGVVRFTSCVSLWIQSVFWTSTLHAGLTSPCCHSSKSKYSHNRVVEQHVGWMLAPASLAGDGTPTPSPSTRPGMSSVTA